MKTLHELNCEIFKIVKDNESIHYTKLFKLIENSEKNDIESSRRSLILDYGLITKGHHDLKLTEKGLKYDSFDLYLKSLKKDPISIHRKRQLILTVLSLLTAIIFGALNYKSNRKVDSLESKKKELTKDYNLLKLGFTHYKDSVNRQNVESLESEIKYKLDTLLTINPAELEDK